MNALVTNNSGLFFLKSDMKREIVSLLSRLYIIVYLSASVPAKITVIVSMGASIDQDIKLNNSVRYISSTESVSLIDLVLKSISSLRLSLERSFRHLG